MGNRPGTESSGKANRSQGSRLIVPKNMGGGMRRRRPWTGTKENQRVLSGDHIQWRHQPNLLLRVVMNPPNCQRI
jgi:hypothetical protein